MSAINTAEELLEIMYLGCYTIKVNNDVLEVSPAFAIDDEMADLIRLHKPNLIKILVSEYLVCL